MRTIMPAFERHGKVGETIGRLVVGYGELEFGLLALVAAITDDMDTAVKALFRMRGESQRLQIADALARQRIEDAEIRRWFENTIGDIQHCLKIRNQYAHCNWIDRPGTDEALRFINFEEIAKKNTPVDQSNLKEHVIDEGLVNVQMAYFIYVDDCLTSIRAELLKRAGKADYHPFLMPAKVPRPLLYKGQGEQGNQDQAKAHGPSGHCQTKCTAR